MTLTNAPTNALATLQTPCETPMQTPLQTQQTPQQTTYTQTPYNPQGVCAPLTRAFYPPANTAALALRSRSQALDRPNREIGLPFVRCWSLASRCTFALEMSSAMQAIEHKPPKQPRIGKKLKQAIDLMLEGTCKNQSAVCERLGLSPSYLSRSLKSEKIQVYVARATAQAISAGRLAATSTSIRLVTNARSEHVQLQASEFILGLNGYHANPSAPGVHINIGADAPGYIVKLRHAQDFDRLELPAAPMIDISPERDE